MAAGPPSVLVAAQSLAVDVATAQVVAALRGREIPSLVLRGPAIARRLYDQGEFRRYVDLDLLVPPADWERAGEILVELGFHSAVAETDLPRHRRPHASDWIRESDRIPIDLHRTIGGVQVADEEVWSALAEDGPTEIVGGEQVVFARPAALALIVALHAAQHGARKAKPLDDLERALLRLDAATWNEAAALARRLGAVATFSAGLRLLPAGAEPADRLELPRALPALVTLRASAAPKLAIGFEWLSRTPGLRAKIGLIMLALAPPPGALRAWRPLAKRGRLGLLGAYLSHPFWLARFALPSLRAYRRARKAAT
ncbi:MAG: nucleotidyltransferase family protein [Gaiellaceae bacterium]